MAVVSGGTTLIDNGALDSAVPTGALILLQTQTASSSSTIDFTSNIDSTYDVYCFKFVNIHPATDNVNFQVNFRDGGSSYDAIKTTTMFRAQDNEGDTQTLLAYHTSHDLAQSTGFQTLEGGGNALSNDNDHGLSGELYLYNPSSTTFVKHFMARTSATNPNDYALDGFVAGYCNVTAAIDGVQFKVSSGNIDSGDIKLYGIK